MLLIYYWFIKRIQCLAYNDFSKKHQKEYTDKCNMFTVMYNTWYVLCLVRITQEMPNFLMLSYEHSKSSTYVNPG